MQWVEEPGVGSVIWGDQSVSDIFIKVPIGKDVQTWTVRLLSPWGSWQRPVVPQCDTIWHSRIHSPEIIEILPSCRFKTYFLALNISVMIRRTCHSSQISFRLCQNCNVWCHLFSTWPIRISPNVMGILSVYFGTIFLPSAC